MKSAILAHPLYAVDMKGSERWSITILSVYDKSMIHVQSIPLRWRVTKIILRANDAIIIGYCIEAM